MAEPEGIKKYVPTWTEEEEPVGWGTVQTVEQYFERVVKLLDILQAQGHISSTERTKLEQYARQSAEGLVGTPGVQTLAELPFYAEITDPNNTATSLGLSGRLLAAQVREEKAIAQATGKAETQYLKDIGGWLAAGRQRAEYTAGLQADQLSLDLEYRVSAGELSQEQADVEFRKASLANPNSPTWEAAEFKRYYQRQQELIQYQKDLQATQEKQRIINEVIARETPAYEAAARMGQAFEGTFGGRVQPRRPEPEPTRELPPIEPEADIYLEQLKSLNPTLRRWFETTGQFSRIMGQFEREQPRAREAWWRELNAPTAYPEPTQAEMTAFAGQWGGSPYEMPFGGEGTPRGAAAIRLGAGYEPPRPKMEDPFKAFLQKYPFVGKFYETPRRERGFFPRQTAPPARWYT